MPLTIAEIRLFGFSREKGHPMKTAYKRDVAISKTHYRRMRIFSDSNDIMVFDKIQNGFYPSCNPKNANTGEHIFHEKKPMEIEWLKFLLNHFDFLK